MGIEDRADVAIEIDVLRCSILLGLVTAGPNAPTGRQGAKSDRNCQAFACPPHADPPLFLLCGAIREPAAFKQGAADSQAALGAELFAQEALAQQQKDSRPESDG